MSRITGLTALALVLSARLAAAGFLTPVTTVAPIDRLFSWDCPQGFSVILHLTGTETYRRFLDQRGVIIRQQTQVRLVSSYTNTVTGRTFSATNAWMYTFSGTDPVSVVGVTSKLTIPGQGTVTLQAGRVVFDYATGAVLFQAGPDEYLSNLCIPFI